MTIEAMIRRMIREELARCGIACGGAEAEEDPARIFVARMASGEVLARVAYEQFCAWMAEHYPNGERVTANRFGRTLRASGRVRRKETGRGLAYVVSEPRVRDGAPEASP